MTGSGIQNSVDIGLVSSHLDLHTYNCIQVIEFSSLYTHSREILQWLNQNPFNAGEAEITGEITAFVRHWLYQHIPNIDKKYSPHFHENGIK